MYPTNGLTHRGRGPGVAKGQETGQYMATWSFSTPTRRNTRDIRAKCDRHFPRSSQDWRDRDLRCGRLWCRPDAKNSDGAWRNRFAGGLRCGPVGAGRADRTGSTAPGCFHLPGRVRRLLEKGDGVASGES